MLEGLAVWALFIYLLRFIGMPWNRGTKAFSYLGGSAWLLFVWVGLINYTPMDIAGGSVVQSPHIQLRPASPEVTGKIKAVHIEPNQKLSKGQLVYELEDEVYQIALNQAKVSQQNAEVAVALAKEDIEVAQAKLTSAEQDIAIANSQLGSANSDLEYKQATLKRYQEQNAAVAHTITENQLDQQSTQVDMARWQIDSLNSQIEQAQVAARQAKLSVEKARLNLASKQGELDGASEALAKAEWNLSQTKVYAPADGYVSNFIVRPGQYIGVMPRMIMYTEEKYVLMRVNHQAIRNVAVGQAAEFSSPVYPGKVFVAEVEGIIEATGEAQASLLPIETSVRQTTGANLNNKHHFVRLKLQEEDLDVPVGSVGLAWVSGEKPVAFLSFLDVIRGIIIRMKSQLYFFYSL
ncbi:HlyD family secretion protein [Paraferrimonas sedimenticola]|uniref:Multidrug resistance protein A n=1 Tax=Paraferrimonas sedimenticola TaxID=375674 RepID=A0AA37RY08_9GAMM|nr:biotin/lipoyl-binding protein [Paraferrimonas sedimenticola]GLP96959.1 multidrug resistance protein A [Paraferrimonas sedimenticola]